MVVKANHKTGHAIIDDYEQHRSDRLLHSARNDNHTVTANRNDEAVYEITKLTAQSYNSLP